MARTEAGLAVERAFPAGIESVRFEIEGVLSLISEAGEKTAGLHHLVLHSLQRTAGKTAWFSFNDYCIAEIPAETPGETAVETALDFTQPWRAPVCFVYRNCSAPEDMDAEGRDDMQADMQSEAKKKEETGETEKEGEGRETRSGNGETKRDGEGNTEPMAPSETQSETQSGTQSGTQSETQLVTQLVTQSETQSNPTDNNPNHNHNTEPTSQSTSNSAPTVSTVSTASTASTVSTASTPGFPVSLRIGLPPSLPSLPSPSSSLPFYTPISLASPSPGYRRLSPAELPGAGDLVAIDCEFVALNCEEVGLLAPLAPRPKFCPTAIASSRRRPISSSDASPASPASSASSSTTTFSARTPSPTTSAASAVFPARILTSRPASTISSRSKTRIPACAAWWTAAACSSGTAVGEPRGSDA